MQAKRKERTFALGGSKNPNRVELIQSSDGGNQTKERGGLYLKPPPGGSMLQLNPDAKRRSSKTRGMGEHNKESEARKAQEADKKRRGGATQSWDGSRGKGGPRSISLT
jgi:hypothetical protein